MTWRTQSAPREGSWRERWLSASARSSLLRSSSLSRVIVFPLPFVTQQFAKRLSGPARPHLYLGDAPPQQAGFLASRVPIQIQQGQHEAVFGRDKAQSPL